MTRLSSDSSSMVDPLYGTAQAEDSDFEVIVELREALGGLPEVTELFGTPDEADDNYNVSNLELRDEAQILSDDGEVSSDISLTSVAPDDDEAGEEESQNYLDSLDMPITLRPEAALPRPAAPDPSQSTSDAAQQFEALRRETDLRLAKMAKFVSDEVRVARDKEYYEAVKLTSNQTDNGYLAGTLMLTALNGKLDADDPKLRTAEDEFLRKQIRQALDLSVDVLVPGDKEGLEQRFAGLDGDLPADEAEAEKHLGDLRDLSSDVNGAIKSRLKAISDLNVDYERLKPIVERALLIESNLHDDLAEAKQEIDAGFAGQFVSDGLSVEEIQERLTDLQDTAKAIFQRLPLSDALEEQKKSLPASAGSLSPIGAPLGAGAFGEVYALANNGTTRLVGKTFKANDDKDKKDGVIRDMIHEAEMYARLGEHPNIARCYGLHDVDFGVSKQPMLVMDMIEGNDVKKVFDDLDTKYRSKELPREEYLASIQHIIKGTLTGLAHFEAMGLVHKDIKGDNVRFDTRTNQAVLIDMGLAQQEGAHRPGSNVCPPLAPPEQVAGRRSRDDEVVTNFWDSFSVGTMLFQEMERDAAGNKNVLVAGAEPMAISGSRVPKSEVGRFPQAARAALHKTPDGQFEATVDAQGQLIGQAIKPGATPDEAGQAGRYGALTEYVDFMNRLTHPNPDQRMSPSEALKHPFMADALLSPEVLERVFGKPTGKAGGPSTEQLDTYSNEDGEPRLDPDDYSPEEEQSSEDVEGLRAALQEHAAAYAATQLQNQPSGISSVLSDESDDPLRDTDQFPEAYSGTQLKDEEELPDDESDDPLRSTDQFPEAYSGTQLQDEEGDLSSDESYEAEGEADKSGVGSSEEDFGPEGDSSPEEAPNDSESGLSEANEEESEEDYDRPTARPAQSVEAELTKGTTALERWNIAQRQIEQQFNTAYSNLAGDDARLKAAGFTKGKKFSSYFTYNQRLHKLIQSLERAKVKRSKDAPKLAAKVTAATKHYREKITRKADTDFGWANAQPAVTPPFWKTMVAALDDVDKWVKS